MYKPFMTCDDPKGVVECGTIRRYRTGSQKMKDKTKSRTRTAESETLETSLTNKQDNEEKKVSKETASFDPSSSLQIMEVSRGAQRLNNMIDSWYSRGLSYDGRSEDIAKDLLKGALDLQESLVMLKKVQEASQHMARLKRKHNEKKPDAKMINRTRGDQFREQSYPLGFQRPWPSADAASSSNCTEELKKVIKESLVKQKYQVPSTSTEVMDSASDVSSTNSSQLLISDSSFSPTTSKKERGPNLVAKLMGLEEITSRTFPTVTPKGEKILNQKNPIFEVDMPKVRKNRTEVEKVNSERVMTPRKILETTHFEGVMKKSSVREPKLQVHHFNDPPPKQFDDLPPIVIMKPRCTHYLEVVKTHEPVRHSPFLEPVAKPILRASDTVPLEEFSVRKLKSKAFPSKTFKQREGSPNMGREMEDVPKRLTREERLRFLKEVVELDAKEIKPIENERAPSKVKMNSRVGHESQLSEETDKKARVKVISRKLPDKEVPKPKIVTRSQGQGEITPTKLRKSQSGPRIDKNETFSRKCTASNTIAKTKNQRINNSKEQKKIQIKKQMPVAEPEAALPVAEQLGQGEEEKSIDVPYKDNCTEIRIITTLADDPTMEHEVYASVNTVREDCNHRPSSSSDDIMLAKSEQENDTTEKSHDTTNCCETNSKLDKEGGELKYLLLTSQSFIGHAEELLNLDLDCPKILHKNGTNGIANTKLYLDCANELTERTSLQESQVVYPFWLTCAGNSRLHISLGKFVEEICDAVENLTSYSENSGKNLPVDKIYAMMERDIKCNGLVNGTWEWGWRHGFSAVEAEQVVNEVESIVLSGLIEEVFINL